MGGEFALTIVGIVHLICGIDGANLLCNSSVGYNLFIEDSTGVARLVERSDAPARKVIAYSLAPGETFIIVPR